MPRRKTSLKEEIRDAMLIVLRDKGSPATARAMAARVLVDLEREGLGSEDEQPAGEMSVADLDREIASIQQGKG